MYVKYFSLSEQPFRLTPDPRFLHLAEAHRSVLSAVLTGIAGRKGFGVLTGPIGTGKTTLLHTIMQVLTRRCAGDQKLSTAFLVNPTLTREEFLEFVLDEFEVSCPATSKPKRLAAFHDHLLQVQRRGGISLLIVDEAHLLSVELLEEIRLLNNLDTYQEKLLQIVLSGQPELTDVLDVPRLSALQQRITVRAELRELTSEETGAYIAQRLHTAGLRGASPFPASAIAGIHAYSNGVPRVINTLCDRSLQIAFEAQSKTIGLHMVDLAADDLRLTSATVARLPEAVVKADSVPKTNSVPVVGNKRSAFQVLSEALRGTDTSRSTT